ncbi:MAG: hypothetical protein EB117_15770, partial [Betaproteobacteria bacterium]|nr:hypothetical protein [Betaproteobacteria bacterium]
ESRLSGLGAQRPASVIEAGLERQRQDARWKSSLECTDATARTSRDFCIGVAGLKEELAASVEAARLEGQRAGLQREVRALEDRGAGRDKDPQARMISRLLRIDAQQSAFGLTVFVAVMVELGAAFGLYLALHHSAPGHAPSPAPMPAARPWPAVRAVETVEPERRPPPPRIELNGRDLVVVRRVQGERMSN